MLVAEVFPAGDSTNQLLRVVGGTMRYQVHTCCGVSYVRRVFAFQKFQKFKPQ